MERPRGTGSPPNVRFRPSVHLSAFLGLLTYLWDPGTNIFSYSFVSRRPYSLILRIILGGVGTRIMHEGPVSTRDRYPVQGRLRCLNSSYQGPPSPQGTSYPKGDGEGGTPWSPGGTRRNLLLSRVVRGRVDTLGPTHTKTLDRVNHYPNSIVYLLPPTVFAS